MLRTMTGLPLRRGFVRAVISSASPCVALRCLVPARVRAPVVNKDQKGECPFFVEEVGVVRAPNRADAECLVRLGFVSTSFGRVHARQAPQRQAGVQSTAALQGQAEEPETLRNREGGAWEEGGRMVCEGWRDGGMEGWHTHPTHIPSGHVG